MRQDDGSELLGANDPRSATIGVIHVAPTDDRQSVLAAILTQDKLGRKQVVVVLPEDNKAFQRPIDFDGLKNMRRGLKAQIVFVAPSGPGPAEFARQRRFPVYSSLESYARALQADGQGSTVVKRGWGFGRRQKPARPESTLPAPAPSTNGIEDEPTHPLPNKSVAPAEQVFTENGTRAKDEDEQNYKNGNAALLGGAGLVAGLGLGAMANGEHGNGSLSPLADDDDWDVLPAPAAGTYAGNGSSSNGSSSHGASMQTDTPPSAHPDYSSNRNGAEPEIILFPTPRPQGKVTGKLPSIPAVVSVPAAQPHPPVVQPPQRQRNSGKMAAVGAGAAAGAGAMMAARGMGAAAPPPPTQVGGGGGGGAPGSPSRNRRLLALAGLILLTLLIIAGIVFAAPGGPHILNVTTSATVTITPAHSDVSGSYTIDAVPGGTTGNSEVEARILSSTKSQSGTVKATGTGHTPATTATGTLTFYNSLTYSQTVGAGTVLTGADGVQVINNAPAVIPAANPPTEGLVTVAAHAVNAGAKGNIAAFDINGTCCLSGVTVQNTRAFSGGQNSQTYTVLSQSDVNNFANPLKASLPTAAKAAVTSQKKANEQFVGSVSCASPTVTSSPPVGQATTNATVTVSVKCSGEVYDQTGAVSLAQSHLKDMAAKNLGTNYALMGDIVVTSEQVSIVPNTQTVALLIAVKGRWVYQFSTVQKQNLAKLIAGKSKQDAINLLLQQPGIDKTQTPTINISGGGTTLPTDPTQIQIILAPVTGFMGTPTPTAGPGTPTGPGSSPTSGPSPTPTPTPTPVNGLGGS
jgi:hypothetical protein